MGAGATVDFGAAFVSHVGESTGPRVPAGSTRGVEIDYSLLVSPNPETTFNLVCDTSGGTAGYVNPQLTAIFVPDPEAFG